jgi:hypothetical protein
LGLLASTTMRAAMPYGVTTIGNVMRIAAAIGSGGSGGGARARLVLLEHDLEADEREDDAS